MFEWLNDSPQSPSPQTNSGTNASATIRVIGDRASGKTTYMAALARWPNANLNSPVQTVFPVTEEGESLVAMAQNILEQGLEMEPTSLGGVNDLKDYQLRITLKESFSWRNPLFNGKNQPVMLDVNCKDYAGEFFNDLLQKAGDPVLSEYLDDCVQASGIMILLDGTSRRYENIANSINKFLVALDRNDLGGVKRRIALVVTKCEQPELWINRQNPQKVINAISPQILQKLQAWQSSGAGIIECFTASAFGMLGTNSPAPNFKKIKASRDGLAAVIREPKRWRPFGLVAPIYWLCTGEKHKKLDGE